MHKMFWAVLTAFVLAPAPTWGQTTPNDTVKNESTALKELKDVVVRGRLPQTRLKGDALNTRIAGSPLQNAGTAKEVLAKIPGMVKKGEDLEVLGRGKPVYYINGRKVVNDDELKNLLSTDIASIEVVTNPGALYDASVNSVVRIKTVKRLGDGFGLTFYGLSEQSLNTGKNAPQGQLNLNYRHKGLDVFASAKEGLYRADQWSDMDQVTSHAVTGEEIYRYDGLLRHHWRGAFTTLSTGFNWQINDQHSLGAKIEYSLTNHDKAQQYIYTNKYDRGSLVETVEARTRRWKNHPETYNGNVYYNGTFGRLNIDFNTNMYLNHSSEYQRSDEQATTENRDIMALNRLNSNLWATKLVLSYPVGKGQIAAGTEETFVDFDQMNRSTGTGLPNVKANVKDNTYAGFAQLTHPLGRGMMLTLGLRYEHATFDYDEPQDATNRLERSYDNLFPSASLSGMLPGNKVNFALTYSSHTQRPSFEQLNQPVSYHNRYVVQEGNPKLKPSIEHTIGLMGNYSFLTLSVNYSYFKDLVCHWSEQINDDGMLRVSYINIAKPKNQLTVALAANKNFGWFVPSWTAAMIKQWLTLDMDNGQHSFPKPMFVFDANNAVRLKNNWQLELNSHLMTRSHYDNIRLTNTVWNLETAVQKSFLKNNALTLRLAWQDMLHKMANDGFIVYGSYCLSQQNKMDTNRISFSVNYRFNAAKDKYKGTGAGQDAIKRMQKGSK